jgi:hypothetical protein
LSDEDEDDDLFYFNFILIFGFRIDLVIFDFDFSIDGRTLILFRSVSKIGTFHLQEIFGLTTVDLLISKLSITLNKPIFFFFFFSSDGDENDDKSLCFLFVFNPKSNFSQISVFILS